jgi:hypothetical protein
MAISEMNTFCTVDQIAYLGFFGVLKSYLLSINPFVYFISLIMITGWVISTAEHIFEQISLLIQLLDIFNNTTLIVSITF